MKILFALFSLILVQSVAWSHNYYFGFAEMQYNEINHTLETTVVLSAHDLEDFFIKSKSINKSLEYLVNDSSAKATVEKFVLESFEVEFENQKADFHLLGFEISPTGMIQIYLLAENIYLKNQLKITFSTMMDVFEAQQNKLTFITNKNKQTAVFLQNQKTAFIDF